MHAPPTIHNHSLLQSSSHALTGSRNLLGMPLTRIQPPKGLSYLGLRELWQFRELFLFLTWRDVQVRYKQTAIGVAWAALQPLMMMIVFTIFLGRMANLPTGEIPYPLFVFCGLLPWTFFATAITSAANSVVGSEKLVTKVYFPRLIIPIAAIGTAVVDVAVASSILVGLLWWYQCPISWTILLAPVCLAFIAAAALGIGAFLAAMNVAYRDFRLILPFLIQLWLFATPSIFMDINRVAAMGSNNTISYWLPWLLNMNPMVLLIATFRDLILGNPIHWAHILIIGMFALTIMLVGCLYFRWVEHNFADVI